MLINDWIVSSSSSVRSAATLSVKASVPGAVQYDLLAAGVIENPYASTKAALAAEWVARTDWAY
ncbi:MAG: hypothetical protein LBC41_11455, partial [Clostridiales bacterium]|nr:hypothetical protein [Clostridiales bacterium]